MLSERFRLRPLTGWALLVFQALWWTALLGAAIAPTVGTYFRLERVERVAPFAELGLYYQAADDGALALSPPVTNEASASGIRAGDRMVAVDGAPAAFAYAERFAVADAIRAAPGPTVRVTTRSVDGVVREHRLTRGPQHEAERYAESGVTPGSHQVITAVMPLIAVFFAIAAAVLLYRRCRGDPVARLLSLSFLLLAMWWPASAIFFEALGAPWLWNAASAAGWITYAIVLATFPGGRFVPVWTLAIPAVASIYVVLSYGFGIYSPIFDLLMAAALCAGVLAMSIRYRRVSSEAEKQQIRWVLYGITLGLLVGIGVILSGVVWDGSADPAHQIWAALAFSVGWAIATMLVSAGLLIALLRFRLYDADAVISRSAGYAVLTLLLAGTFGASAKLIEWLFESGFGEEAGALPGAIGAGLAVVLITPLNGRIQRWAEGRFRKGLTALKTEIPVAADDLRETASMGELLDELLVRVNDGVRATRSAVMMDGRQVARQGEDAADGLYPLTVPLRAGGSGPEVATLLVGPRPDGSLPGKDERGILHDVAAPIARAIAVVRRREAREAALDARLAAIEAKLAKDGEKATA